MKFCHDCEDKIDEKTVKSPEYNTNLNLIDKFIIFYHKKFVKISTLLIVYVIFFLNFLIDIPTGFYFCNLYFFAPIIFIIYIIWDLIDDKYYNNTIILSEDINSFEDFYSTGFGKTLLFCFSISLVVLSWGDILVVRLMGYVLMLFIIGSIIRNRFNNLKKFRDK